MSTSPKELWLQSANQIQHLAADIAEGIVLIDAGQAIRWANPSALAMHGIGTVDALGATLEEYYANFQVKFLRAAALGTSLPAKTDSTKATTRESLIEMTVLSLGQVRRVFRLRHLPLNDDCDRPTGAILIMLPTSYAACHGDALTVSLNGIPSPAALVRVNDSTIVEVNDAFCRATGVDRNEALANAPIYKNWQTSDGGPNPPEGPAAAGASTVASGTARKSHVRWPELQYEQLAEFRSQECKLLYFKNHENPSAERTGLAMNAITHLIGSSQHENSEFSWPMAVLDLTMRIRGMNELWLTLLGYSKDEMLAREVSDFLSASSGSEFRGTVASLRINGNSRQRIKCQLVCAAGDTREAVLALSSVPDQRGTAQCIILSVIDQTQLVHPATSFGKLAALIPTPLIVRRSNDGRVIHANTAFTALTGNPLEQLLGRAFDELGIFETRAHRQQLDQELKAKGQARGIEARVKAAHGETMDCLVSAESLHLSGEPCDVVLIEDVTDRRRNEAQLFQAIETVMADTTWFSRSVIEKLAALRAPPRVGGRLAELGELTPREREVLGLISHGLSDIDIAEKLRLTRSTVRNHVATLYSKIDVHSRSSAIVWARERGINIAWPTTTTPSFMRAPGSYRGISRMSLDLKKHGSEA